MDNLIRFIFPMQNKQNEQHALYLLRYVASLVKPIMINRGYRIGTLTEFYPKEDKTLYGLNMNAGKEIRLRLRHPNDETVWVELDVIIEIMLHELAHNVVGPHNNKFHALLGEHRKEYAILRDSGYNGEGFYTTGERLGKGKGVLRHLITPSLTSGRLKFLEAVEKKTAALEKKAIADKATTNTNRPIKKPLISLPLAKEVLRVGAAVAIEGTKVLANGTTNTRRNPQIFRTASEEQEANDRAILQALQEFSWEDQPGDYGETSATGARTPVQWACTRCTLLNFRVDTKCGACGARKPWKEWDE